MRTTILLGALLALGACARSMAPPGGDRDELAPRLVSTTPAPLTTITDLAEPAVFQFDERLRTRNFNRTLVSVMPGRPDDFEIQLDGDRLVVRPHSGWNAGQIYQIVVRPGIEDLFGNKRDAATELVFSTGPAIPGTAVAGLVQDRITGTGARDAVVEAVRRADSAVYRAVGDSISFFALRHVPYGVYDVTAFSDRNRNSRQDASEPADGPTMMGLGAGTDTLTLFFNLLPRDSTAPRLTRVETMDSLHLRLTFDDYIDPDTGIAQAQVSIFQAQDSAAVLLAFSMNLAPAFQALQRQRPAPADSTAAADSTPPARPQPERPGRAAGPDPATLPDRSVVITLGQRLPPGEYALVASGFRNVNGLPGGGHQRFEVRAPASGN